MRTDTQHPAYKRLFRPGLLSIGLVLPLSEVAQPRIDHARQFALAAQADRLGFDALWVRDVPLNSANYPDPAGHLDPWVHLGALAAHTHKITLVTGAIVTPLRHPLHVAKGALSVDAVSNGRFILGLGSGDRPAEFAAFEQQHGQRAPSYRRHWERIAAALDQPSRILVEEDGVQAPEQFEILPAPVHGGVPMLTVGSSQQTLEWIARNAGGWVTYHRPLEVQQGRIALWKNAVERVTDGAFRSFSSAFSLQLSEHADAAPQAIALGYQLGRCALVDMLEQHRDMGVHHVMFNISSSARPVEDILEELAREVLPKFQRD